MNKVLISLSYKNSNGSIKSESINVVYFNEESVFQWCESDDCYYTFASGDLQPLSSDGAHPALVCIYHDMTRSHWILNGHLHRIEGPAFESRRSNGALMGTEIWLFGAHFCEPDYDAQELFEKHKSLLKNLEDIVARYNIKMTPRGMNAIDDIEVDFSELESKSYEYVDQLLSSGRVPMRVKNQLKNMTVDEIKSALNPQGEISMLEATALLGAICIGAKLTINSTRKQKKQTVGAPR